MIEKDGVIGIQDNFLEEDKFVALRDILFSPPFPWYFQPEVVDADENKDNTCPGFLAHPVFNNNAPRSPLYEPQFLPILNAMEVSIVMRIQVNLNWRLPQPFTSTFHTDTKQEELMTAGWITSIFYINTNNGYTELETGEKIESIANRLVSFPANIKHRICTQTDTQRRILINFNYLRQNIRNI